MATVNYLDISSLSKLDLEDLLDNDSILTLYQAISFVAKQKENLPTLENFVEFLTFKNFYLPTLSSYNNEIGFFLSNGFVAFNTNFKVGDQIPSQSKEKNEPVRYNVSFGDEENRVEIAVKFLPGTSIKQLLILEELISELNDDNEAVSLPLEKVTANINKVAALLKPAPLDTLPAGSYKVSRITKSEKSSLIILDNGMEVIANRATPDQIQEVTSVAGCLYASKAGRVLRGISVTGLTKRVIPENGVEEDYVGKMYKVVGQATCNGGNADYFVAKMAVIKEDGTYNNPEWLVVSGSDSELALSRIRKNKDLTLEISSVTKPFGKMVYPRPIFVSC